MFFPKLIHLNKHDDINDFVVNKFDSWLASQPEMYTDYLNPLDFIEECKINKKLGLITFSLASNVNFFKKLEENPLLKIKYIVSCPTCGCHFKTYNNNLDIPKKFVQCVEECDEFNPSLHPEKIEIYYELLDEPIIGDNDLLLVYEKSPRNALTVDVFDSIWNDEEGIF